MVVCSQDVPMNMDLREVYRSKEYCVSENTARILERFGRITTRVVSEDEMNSLVPKHVRRQIRDYVQEDCLAITIERVNRWLLSRDSWKGFQPREAQISNLILDIGAILEKTGLNVNEYSLIRKLNDVVRLPVEDPEFVKELSKVVVESADYASRQRDATGEKYRRLLLIGYGTSNYVSLCHKRILAMSTKLKCPFSDLLEVVWTAQYLSCGLSEDIDVRFRLGLSYSMTATSLTIGNKHDLAATLRTLSKRQGI